MASLVLQLIQDSDFRLVHDICKVEFFVLIEMTNSASVKFEDQK